MLIDVGIEVGDKVKFIKKEESATDTDVPLGSVGVVTQVFDLSSDYPKHYDVVFNNDGKIDFDIFYEGELELVGGEVEVERELFEEFAYSKKWNTARVCDMGLDHYVDDFVDGAWIGWQASVNRDGFVLVPVEPSRAVLDNIYDNFVGACEMGLGSDVTSKSTYKVVIEAANEN